MLRNARWVAWHPCPIRHTNPGARDPRQPSPVQCAGWVWNQSGCCHAALPLHVCCGRHSYRQCGIVLPSPGLGIARGRKGKSRGMPTRGPLPDAGHSDMTRREWQPQAACTQRVRCVRGTAPAPPPPGPCACRLSAYSDAPPGLLKAASKSGARPSTRSRPSKCGFLRTSHEPAPSSAHLYEIVGPPPALTPLSCPSASVVTSFLPHPRPAQPKTRCCSRSSQSPRRSPRRRFGSTCLSCVKRSVGTLCHVAGTRYCGCGGRCARREGR